MLGSIISIGLAVELLQLAQLFFEGHLFEQSINPAFNDRSLGRSALLLTLRPWCGRRHYGDQAPAERQPTQLVWLRHNTRFSKKSHGDTYENIKRREETNGTTHLFARRL